MTVTSARLHREFLEAGVLLEHRGPDVPVLSAAAADSCGPGQLVFVDGEAHVGAVLERRPAAVVTTGKLASSFPGMTVLVSPDVKLAQALIRQKHFDRDLRAAGWPRIHPSAVVHESAVVAASAAVGPLSVVGRGARVGERCVLLANVVVEEDAVLGDDTVVHPGAVIGFRCEIGRGVIVRAGAIVGSEGFGFAQDGKRRNHRVPQTGNVIVGDGVVIGAGCCIDRGTFGPTRIGAGTVMDNLCHVAHNVQIGEDCILTAMLCVAGSTTIGDRVVTSGMTGILDHVRVPSDTVLLHRAGVMSDIPGPGAYAGAPVQPLRQYLKNLAVAHKLAELRDRVRDLEGMLEDRRPEGTPHG